MKNFYLFFIFIVIVMAAMAFAQKDNSEIRDETSTMAEDKQRSDPELTGEENAKNFQNRQHKTTHTVNSDSRPMIVPKQHVVHYSDYIHNEGAAIPNLGFSNNPRQNIYLSDYTGEYDVELQNFQRGKPTKFQAALGAISAHILNQRNNQEYIPYPPNGDPRNYPAYHGNPHGTEPPAVRAYERASKTNYDVDVRPLMDFNQRTPSRLLSLEDYRRAISNHFQNSGRTFYTDSTFHNQEPLQPDLRSSQTFYEYR